MLTAQAAGGKYLSAIHFARSFTRLGDNERAFEWLEKASHERTVFPLLMHADPLYDSLRSDPRFVDLLADIPSSNLQVDFE
jgi:hypothetical protein